MTGWYKAKESYKEIPDDKSLKAVATFKHEALLSGEAVYLNPVCSSMGVDFSEHLEACDKPAPPPEPSPEEIVEEVVEEAPEKSAEPSDGWTKDELKVYMDANDIEYNSGDTKQDLLDKINEGGLE